MLDVGHATGIWVYEFAKANGGADVWGIDLFSRTPPRAEGDIANAHFMAPVDFTQGTWPFPPSSFDMIRMSQLCGSVPDWTSLYRNVATYVRPRIGFVEHVELAWEPRSMDPAGFPERANELLHWYRNMQQASRMFGKPIDCPANIDAIMQQCGLVDVTHRTVQIPLRPRKGDQRDFNLSWAFRWAMSALYDDGRPAQGFESLTMSLFTRQLRRSPAAVANLCARLRAVVNDEKIPIYFNL